MAEDRRSVLVTGATGAVGRCVVDELLPDERVTLVLVVRDAERLPRAVRLHERVTVIEGDLRRWGELANRLPHVGHAVLLATSWGDDADEVNVRATIGLASALFARGLEHLVWFGTASVLDREHAALADALERGTPYIRSKAECRRELLARFGNRVTIVHPTLVVAGDDQRPWSHAARLLRELDKHAWLARWLTGDGSLHLIHAADLSRIVRALVTMPASDAATLPREIVAGVPPIGVHELIDLVLERGGRGRRAALDLTPRRVDWLVRLFRVQLSPWDRLCLEQRHFVYRDARAALVDGSTNGAANAARYPDARSIIRAVPRQAPSPGA